MDNAFGALGWTQESFEAAVPGTVFSPTTSFVFLEGSDAHANELNTFLIANLGLIETWVTELDEIDNLFPDYICYFKSAVNSIAVCRAMSGIVVYVKRSISHFVKQIETLSSTCLFIRAEKNYFQT